ncbi:MBL fold metallo-hydrolase [Psychrobacter arenosus]|uniref:MBL fold metallo-hydrolase n=1 Tax=Psychrobacter arenosus TaxID=256326 RepID=UPI0019185219|nr:MBL fold metallo-hydrolase [Psychrobacter arenosus]
MIYLLLLIVKWLLIFIVTLVVVIAVGTWLFLKLAPTFGGRPDAETLARIKASKYFNGETFVNLVPTHATTLDIDDVTDGVSPEESNILKQFLFPPKGKNPSRPIASYRLGKPQAGAKQPTAHKLTLTTQPLAEGEFVWLGHSTVLFRLAGKTIITDPVFHRASPAPIGGKPFAMTHAPKVADLPFIDVVLISHDHYDHLDHKAIKQLMRQKKAGHFYAPLGVKAHLVLWGVPDTMISEFDWYEAMQIASVEPSQASATDALLTEDALRVVFTPTRHFSGRRIKGHRTTLWGSWVVQSATLNVYFSGDGGYSSEFANIGERYGPFDIAFMEDGAYNERWRDVHMLPEESAQAGFDLQAKVVLPIHWGKFDLSTHHWRDPVRRIKQAVAKGNTQVAVDKQIKLATPRVGEVFTLDKLPTEAWWEAES